MQIFCVLILTLIFVQYGYGQNASSLSTRVRAENTIHHLTDNNGLSNGEVLNGIPLPPGNIKGDTYFLTEWLDVEIRPFKTGSIISGYKGRLNFNGDQLEFIASGGEVRVAETSKVASFSFLRNGSQFTFVNSQVVGIKSSPPQFLQVLSEGTYSLLKSVSIVVKEPTYRPDVGVGDPDYKILKRSNYFLLHHDSIQEVDLRNKKKFSQMFSSKADDVKELIEANELDLKNEDHLKLIFQRLNASASEQ